MDEELELYKALEERIRRSNELVEKLARGDERVKLLETIPGIGRFFALLIAHEVDDVSRFPNEKNHPHSSGVTGGAVSTEGGSDNPRFPCPSCSARDSL
jgi:transposase